MRGENLGSRLWKIGVAGEGFGDWWCGLFAASRMVWVDDGARSRIA